MPDHHRIDVRKTHKLYIGGRFPRSESGMCYPVTDPGGAFLANAARASRKDLRDAVEAARAASATWSGLTAYNRGQILYRIAEMMEDRRTQLVMSVRQAEGDDGAEQLVDLAIDRWVWYAGWADKLAQVLGNPNPVAGPYFNLSVPEPCGVVGVLAPEGSALLGLVSVIAPVIVSGNTAVVVSSHRRPLPAVQLAEVFATADLPSGAVNVLTGDRRELAPWLAGHQDVNGIDLAGAAGDPTLAVEVERRAADTIKRVRRTGAHEPDWTVEPGLAPMTGFVETKTVWHPQGR